MIKQPPSAAALLLRNLMEKPAPKSPPPKDYVHYRHTDACSLSRWTAKESYQFMYERPWQKVNDFYLDAVNGRRSLSELFGKQTYVHAGDENVEDCDKSELVSVPADDGRRTGRWERVTFKILLSYHGSSFDGWQKQPGLNTVQGLIEGSLGQFVDENKVKLLKEKKLRLDGHALVAGRTDKGVTAIEQVCSFYTWRKDVKALDIKEALNGAAPGKIRVISVSQVSREFHPNFSAKWRRYFYIFPLADGKGVVNQTNQCKKNDLDSVGCTGEEHGYTTNGDDQNELQTGNKPLSFEVSRVNQLLHQLEGKLLSFRMFARDTKASRNIGPPTECFIFHARAAEAFIPCPEDNYNDITRELALLLKLLHSKVLHPAVVECLTPNYREWRNFCNQTKPLGYARDGTSTKVMCIELVANRFLRKMVRVVVATAIRESAAGADEDALLKLMDATCRRATAPPAPPDGLCLVDVGYTEFDGKSCLIP